MRSTPSGAPRRRRRWWTARQPARRRSSTTGWRGRCRSSRAQVDAAVARGRPVGIARSDERVQRQAAIAGARTGATRLRLSARAAAAVHADAARQRRAPSGVHAPPRPARRLVDAAAVRRAAGALCDQAATQAPLPRVRPYRDYLAWLAAQDREAALAAWRGVWPGLTSRPGWLAPRCGGAADRARTAAAHVLRAPLTATLRQLARAHGLTLNTVVQGRGRCCWGG